MTYRYATLLRPPGPGAVPRDGLLQCGYTEDLTPSGRRSWGWAEYDHQLSPEDIAHYDLEPVFDADNNRAGADIPRQKGMNTMNTMNEIAKTATVTLGNRRVSVADYTRYFVSTSPDFPNVTKMTTKQAAQMLNPFPADKDPGVLDTMDPEVTPELVRDAWNYWVDHIDEVIDYLKTSLT